MLYLAESLQLAGFFLGQIARLVAFEQITHSLAGLTRRAKGQYLSRGAAAREQVDDFIISFPGDFPGLLISPDCCNSLD
jgi:hypothetical protein